MPNTQTLNDVESPPFGTDTENIINMMKAVIMAIVGRPDAVSVLALEKDNDVVITVDVAIEDVGKVLGKQGRTARSLRTIMGAAAAPMGKTFSLNITNTKSFPER